MIRELSLLQVLKHRDAIYGFCALWIIIFHVFVQTNLELFYPLKNFISCGNCGVDIFLFLSGLCLCLSFKKKETIDYREYYSKRAIRVLIPYIVISLPYWIWKSTVEHPESSLIKAIIHVVADFSSATFWLRGTQTTWFVFAICVFYMLFPWFFKIIRKSKKAAVLLFTFTCAFGAISSAVPVLKNSSIVWARVPIFIVGVIAGEHYNQISFKAGKYNAIVGSSLVLFITFCVIFSLRRLLGSYPVALWYSYGIMTFAVITCLTVFLQITGGKLEALFGFLGTISLELYLVHIPVLHVLRFCGVLAKAGKWNYVILPLISIPLAFIGRRLCVFLTFNLIRGT